MEALTTLLGFAGQPECLYPPESNSPQKQHRGLEMQDQEDDSTLRFDARDAATAHGCPGSHKGKAFPAAWLVLVCSVLTGFVLQPLEDLGHQSLQFCLISHLLPSSHPCSYCPCLPLPSLLPCCSIELFPSHQPLNLTNTSILKKKMPVSTSLSGV